MTDNPYSAPAVEVTSLDAPSGDTDLQILGLRAFGATPVHFPASCCVRCGSDEPGGKRVKKKLAWCSPWVALLLLINVLVLLIVYLFVRKVVNVEYYLCPKCWTALKRRVTVNALLWTGFLAMVIAAVVMESAELGLACIPAFFVALIFGAALGRYPIRVAGYDKPLFELKGFSGEFVRAHQPATLD